MTDISTLIHHRLSSTLNPTSLEIIDNSAAHAGHAGARSGGGHFQVMVVSAAFEGKSSVARHQLIYSALGDMMKNEIHALSIQAFTPSEKN